jgi:hypothetical protein
MKINIKHIAITLLVSNYVLVLFTFIHGWISPINTLLITFNSYNEKVLEILFFGIIQPIIYLIAFKKWWAKKND